MKTQANTITVDACHTCIESATIYSEVAGSGPPLVLIHGLAGSTRWWTKNIEALARRFRVYVIDLIGFGQSRCEQPFVLSEAAAYLAKWMEQMGLERASVVGHSMGGLIAAEFAADFPHLVDHLVLVDAAALPFDKTLMPGPLELIRTLPYLPFNFLDVLIPDVQRAGVKTIIKAAREMMETDIRAKLAQIKAPTLVIWGENDPMIPLKLGRKLAASLPCRELAVIRGAGHNPMWEKPALFNQVITDFLSHTHLLNRRETQQPARRPLVLGAKPV